ncbi:MAG TPA: hypothetical protein VGZ73_14050 [Bryobacteraceae bacterium]|nr:hypothetical protein [Bryobacteraceae bacterium]
MTRIADVTLRASLCAVWIAMGSGARADLLSAVPGTDKGFVGFAVNEIEGAISDKPALSNNPLTPSGFVRCPGADLPCLRPAPLFFFSGLVPLPIGAVSFGGDPLGRFGSGAVTVTQDPVSGVGFQIALQDQPLTDSRGSSAAARGAVTYINNGPGDVVFGSVGLSLALKGHIPGASFEYLGLTGLIDGQAINPVVLGGSGPGFHSPNLVAAFGDSADGGFDAGDPTLFLGHAVSYLLDAQKAIEPLVVHPGDTMTLDFTLSAFVDPGASFEFTQFPANVAAPAFGASASSLDPVPEPGAWMLLATVGALLLGARALTIHLRTVRSRNV